jgi:hypothetical protein
MLEGRNVTEYILENIAGIIQYGRSVIFGKQASSPASERLNVCSIPSLGEA